MPKGSIHTPLNLTPHAASVELGGLWDDVSHVECLTLSGSAKIGADHCIAGEVPSVVTAMSVIVVLSFSAFPFIRFAVYDARRCYDVTVGQ